VEAPSFKKSLKLFDATALVIGSMIGSGIFIVGSDMARTLGSPGWLLVAWAITGVLTVIAALSYGELAAMMPQAGGQYIYLREAYNPLAGFLYGWTMFTVIQTGTIAAVAMAFAKFLGVLVPWFSEKNVWLELGFLKLNTVHIAAIGSILILTWINTRGISKGKAVQNIFTYSKLFILLAFIITGLLFAHNQGAIDLNSQVFWKAAKIENGQIISLAGFALVAAIGTSMVGSLFSSDAWNNITFAAGEVVNPRKTIPLSLFIGTITVMSLYLLATLVYTWSLPLRGVADGATVFERGIQFATNDRLATASIYGLFGQFAEIIMAAFIVISTFGCNNGIILSGARVYYAMANDGLFFKKAGELNSRSVPAAGLIAQSVWASLLCLSGTYSNLLDYVIFAVLIFYVMTILGIFILRIKKPDAERPYRAFLYPVLPGLYILAALFVMFILLIYKPMYTWPGLIIVLAGIPVYFIRERSLSRNKEIG
jgi:basic amino acid/polyamine antiporter, APA family